MLRIAAIIMLPLFILSMAVQYNDPDPIRWMLIYLVPAIYSGMAIRKKYHWSAIPFAAAFVWGVLYWMPGTPIDNPMNLMTDVKMVNMGVEEWREDGGLAICAVWMIVVSIAWALDRRSSTLVHAEPAAATQS